MTPRENAAPKNLVMGFATNQSEASIRVFCRSLRSIYSENVCDVAIITNRYHTYFSELVDLGIRFDSTPNNYSKTTSRPTKAVNRAILHSFRLLIFLKRQKWLPEVADAYELLLETWHHPQLARWFAYRRLLSLNQVYSEVFLADVKDVVFQAPFFGLAAKNKVTLFADANLYGSCYWNDSWYIEAYGKDALAQVAGKSPICVGTMLGCQEAMLDLLNQFTATMARSPFGRIEQAIFNHMLYTNSFKVPLETEENIHGPVATLGSKAAYEAVALTDGAIRRARDNSIIPVVHMYDRWSDLAAYCTKTFAGILVEK